MTSTSCITILTIEDEPPVREGIATYLEDSGYVVLQAENGSIGLEVFRRESPDLILVDLRMPEVDGLEVLATVTKESPDTPAIVVSGAGMIGDAVEALHMGAWDYVLKPISDMEVLLHAVRKALERSRLLIENKRYQEHLEELVRTRTAELQKEITERKRAEEALRIERDNLETITRNIGAGLAVISKDYRTLWANEIFKQIFGDVEGKACYAAYNQRAEICPGCGVREVFDKGEEQVVHEQMGKDVAGQTIWSEIIATPIKDAEGNTTAALELVVPITERKRAQEEKEKLQTQLQQAQKMEAIGTLAGGIAHDFNNILGVIIGCSELAQLDIPEGAKTHRYLNQVLDAGDRATDLVQQILTFSRQKDTERRPVEVGIIFKEALNLLRSSLPSTIKIHQNIEARSGLVLADPTQMHQVLINLCTNAAHAMREKGGILEITVTKMDFDSEGAAQHPDLRSGPYIRLGVSDTGHGMDREMVARIFDPYFTTKAPGEGTGLGLAVVHGIVRSYAGAISIQSELGRGTTFQVFFPRVEFPEGPAETDKIHALPTGNERVLLVDDEEVLVRIVKEMLEFLGYEVVDRTSSIEALKSFRASPERFDLVITDMTMPNMTGEELAQELIGIRPDIPIILCTGFSERITENKARDLGIRGFIMKPLVIHKLAEKIREALDSRIDY